MVNSRDTQMPAALGMYIPKWPGVPSIFSLAHNMVEYTTIRANLSDICGGGGYMYGVQVQGQSGPFTGRGACRRAVSPLPARWLEFVVRVLINYK